jgi:hypothetical protein
VKDLEIETQETQKPLRPIKRRQSNLPVSHSRANIAHRLLYQRDFASIPPNLRKSQAAKNHKVTPNCHHMTPIDFSVLPVSWLSRFGRRRIAPPNSHWPLIRCKAWRETALENLLLLLKPIIDYFLRQPLDQRPNDRNPFGANNISSQRLWSLQA